MGIRLTQDEAISRIQKRGYTLVGSYKSAKENFSFICPKNHRGSMPWSSFNNGHGCKECAELAKSDRYKFTQQQAEQIFKEKGCTLLSEYKNARTKVSFRCDKAGHIGSVVLESFKNSKTVCAACAGRVKDKQAIREYIESKGYTLRRDYEGSTSGLHLTCPAGHDTETMLWVNFRKGVRCRKCASNYTTHEQVEEALSAGGLKLLSKYKNKNTKIKYRCADGHEGSMLWGSFNRGARCATCSTSGFSRDKPASLYYLAFYHPEHLDAQGNSAPLYKIGVTNRTIQERFAPEPTPYRIVHENRYLFGSIAQDEEQRILTQHAAHKYTGANLLVSGNTELFTSDILNLDKDAHKQSPLPDRRSA
jgi:hypothetical protein